MNIYINDGSIKIPEDETCYIVAKDGIYLQKNLDLVQSLTPVDKISFLEELPSFAKMNIPKIPTKLFANILTFFKEVYKLYKSEAVVLLFYNKSRKSYRIYVPEQEVSGGSVNYKTEKTIKDFNLIGSIHSHASMSAFHSGTDKNDEENFDGIHMTIGKVDEEFFDICSSIVVNGLRVPILPQDYVENLECREYTNYFPHMFRPAFEFVGLEKFYKNNVKTSYGYTLICDKKDLKFEKFWLRKVKEKVYKYENFNNIFGGGVYKFINGKLEKVDSEKKTNNIDQIGFGFNDVVSCMQENDEKSKNPCKTCIHRNSKLELIKEESEQDPQNLKEENNKEFDFSSFDLGYY